MNVAIFDDGIDKSQIKTPVVTYSFLDNNDYANTELSHGTICAKIIEKYGDIDTFYDIKVLNSSRKGSITTLINALKYCLDLNVSIINLSIGIESFNIYSKEYKTLYKVCKSLKNKHIRIIAAQSNSGARTIPADFDIVDSVEDIFSYINSSKILYRKSDYYAISIHLIESKEKHILTEKCNSFACAYMTAISTKQKSNGFVKGRYKITSTSYFHNRKLSYNKKSDLLQKDFQTALREKLSFFNSPIISFINILAAKDVEIPIIEIIRCPDSISKSIWFAKKLQNQFIKNGYTTNTISTLPISVLYDIDFFPRKRLKLVTLFKKASNSDVIILLTDKRSAEYKEDLFISLKKNSFYCIDQNKLLYTDQYRNSGNLFKFILRYYSDN